MQLPLPVFAPPPAPARRAKGGRERRIPILTEAQRMWLEEAKQLVQYKSHSLIPADTTYKTYRKRFEQACSRAGVTHRHGLRHLYAQNRYLELTGWSSPLKGGLTRKNLSEAQKSSRKTIISPFVERIYF